VRIVLAPGWHVNANPPAFDYNIPTEVAIESANGITAGAPRYPAGIEMKLGFEDQPLKVYDALVVVPVPLSAGATATAGTLRGKVRFQACNDQVCLAPAEVAFDVAVNLEGAAAAAPASPATPSAAATPPTTHAAAPAGAPTGGSITDRLQRAFADGGFAWFLFLFVGGLLLNLTPCVFPMLGITVSIFGARRQEALPRVVTTAVLYVLGICVTYTVLGVVAALTGSLFGSALQSAWVNLVLGGLLLLLSLGMFGVYEMQPPSWVMDRLGGAQATSFAGAFLSGLGVGIIAAPCVGPLVVAVLALVAQKGSLAFGVQTMFTLSLGLGFPYLFLATFSNLLQSLPRSGDWMVWVKHGFGVIMASIGLNYLAIGLAPDLAPWVAVAALVLGGLWLGFLDHSSGRAGGFRAFTRLVGVLAIALGVWNAVGVLRAERAPLAWRAYSEQAVQASLAAGRPVIMDFSADWCMPCRELEHKTFPDARVRAEGGRFDLYRVDLTKYDTPESEEARRRYGITGVPEVLFLTPGRGEQRDLRVIGFLEPGPFAERMRSALTR
jgi:thiol:disulfide interchange protein DsbD